MKDNGMGNPSKFKGKYRIMSARRPGWDYTGSGVYFVTMCTEGRVRWFGNIINGDMRLSDVGTIIVHEWLQTAVIRPYITLDECIVMPDHIHGIVIMGNHQRDAAKTPSVETPWHGVSTMNAPTVAPIMDVPMNAPTVVPMINTPMNAPMVAPRNPHHHHEWQSGSLGSIMQQFKRACTKRIREIGHADFAWQPRFHDRIIGDTHALESTRLYIRKNPQHWKSR